MAGVFQHHCEFQQQDGVVGIHGKLIGHRLGLRPCALVAEFHHSALARRQKRQLVAGVGVTALLGNHRVPTRGNARILQGISKIAILARHPRSRQVGKIRALGNRAHPSAQAQQ